MSFLMKLPKLFTYLKNIFFQILNAIISYLKKYQVFTGVGQGN